MKVEFPELRQDSDSASDGSERSKSFSDDSDSGSEVPAKAHRPRVKMLERAKLKISSWGSREAKKDE